MGFIQNIVMPLFEGLNVFLGSPAIDTCCIQQLKDNHAHWEQRNTKKRRFTVKSAIKLEPSRTEFDMLTEKVRSDKRG